MKLGTQTRYVVIAIGVVVLGGGLYAGAQSVIRNPKKHIPSKQLQENTKADQSSDKQHPASQPTSKSTAKSSGQQSNVVVPSTNTQTPWHQGPSDQEPAGVGAGVSGGASIDPGVAPWGQGPSDQ